MSNYLSDLITAAGRTRAFIIDVWENMRNNTLVDD